MPPFGAHGANTAFKDAQVFANVFSNGFAMSGVTDKIGAFEAAMDRYSEPAIKSAKRQMTMATTDFPFKQAIFRTLFRGARAFSGKAERRSLDAPDIAAPAESTTVKA